MATRRIARGRAPSPVPVIVLSVIVVGLLASTIIFGMKVGDLTEQQKLEQGKTKEAKDELTAAHTEFQKYEDLVGLDLENLMKQYEQRKDALVGEHNRPVPSNLYSAGEPQAKKGPFDKVADLLDRYADWCHVLRWRLEDLKQKLDTAQKQRDDYQEKGRQEAALRTTEVDAERTKREDAEKTAADKKKELDAEIKTLKGQIAALTEDKNRLDKQVSDLTEEAKLKGEKITDLQALVEELKRPTKTTEPLVGIRAGEPVDGRIISVDADGQHVTVDLGRKDWVGLGMQFTVFDNADPESRQEKGQIQIRRVKDTIAIAKVLKQDENDPLLSHMVLVNPAFERGKELEFVLEGKFRVQDVDRLLLRYPCRLAKTVTRNTDYLVIGEGDPGDVIDPLSSKNVAEAEKLGVRIMNERDLVRYLGEGR